MGEPGAHARLMELEDTLGLEFDGPLASQVIALIEHMTAEAYSELLQAVEKHSLAALIQLIALQNEDSQLEV